MLTTRTYNFSAGPAMLPESVLKTAQRELLNWDGLGCSVMEISHRSPQFRTLLDKAENSLRSLLNIPNDYHVLFLSGATRTQFAMLPMNLLTSTERGAYLISGVWSEMAFKEASQTNQAYCVSNSESSNFLTLPEYDLDDFLSNTAYLYYIPNETIQGIRFPTVPTADVPLIADMTSCLLTEPIRVSDYGVIFAGTQKNIGPAGLTIVIIRNSLLENMPENSGIPTMLDYRTHVKHRSLYATPPSFNCYMTALMLEWMQSQGGVETLFQQNCEKAAKLYQAIDDSPHYHCPVTKEARSIVNVCFTLAQSGREDAFFKQAEQRGLYGLRGHRLTGGIRASLYNAMSMAGVEALVDFMSAFR